MKLPGFERKLRVAIDWTLDLFFPRDIIYLRPLHTSHHPGPVAHETRTPDVPERASHRRSSTEQSPEDLRTTVAP
jgi:hypothetical protein